MPRNAAACLLVAMALWLAPSAARACSCLPPPPPDDALNQAGAVFEGRATGVGRDGMVVRYSFEVSRVWKGDVGSHAEIFTASDSAACGRTYDEGESYLVYAYRGTDGRLGDGLCTRTRKTSRALEDLAVLGPGTAVGGSADANEPDPATEPPRIEPPVSEAAPPPSEPNPRGCALENAHTPQRRGLALLVGAAIAIRRRRIVRSKTNTRESTCRSVSSKFPPPTTSRFSPMHRVLRSVNGSRPSFAASGTRESRSHRSSADSA